MNRYQNASACTTPQFTFQRNINMVMFSRITAPLFLAHGNFLYFRFCFVSWSPLRFCRTLTFTKLHWVKWGMNIWQNLSLFLGNSWWNCFHCLTFHISQNATSMIFASYPINLCNSDSGWVSFKSCSFCLGSKSGWKVKSQAVIDIFMFLTKKCNAIDSGGL